MKLRATEHTGCCETTRVGKNDDRRHRRRTAVSKAPFLIEQR
jgi:hypothetical protein